MTTTPAFLGAWGCMPNASEKRNINQLQASPLTSFTPSSVAGFNGGWALLCSSSASGPAFFEANHLDDLTLVDGDVLYVMCQIDITAWVHATAGAQPFLVADNARHAAIAGYATAATLRALDTDTSIHGILGDGTNTLDTGAVLTYSLATVYTLMMAVERVSSTSAKITVYQWSGGTWNDIGSASGTFSWSTFGSFKSVSAGSPITFAKGDNGTIYVSNVIPSVNVIPAGTMVCDSAVLVETPDGSTYDEFVDAAAGATVNDDVDDVLGSESTADYMTSTSTTAQKTQELNFAAVSGITDTIRGIVVSVGVSVVPATANATAYMAMRLSGTDSTFLDAYYGDSAWDTSGNGEAKDTHRFFEKDPAGATWTQTNVNSATGVVRKVATGAAEQWDIHSLVLQVLHGDVWTPPAAGARRIFVM